MVDRHDLIILGTGVGGAEVAAQAAGKGLDVLAIEQRLVGGECPYWGCIPSKAMARASGVLGEAARVESAGREIGGGAGLDNAGPPGGRGVGALG